MIGIWFMVLIAAFVAAGVLTQLGWELDPMLAVKRALRRRRSRRD
jgi:cytochrome c biogenesis protein ResB